MAEPFWEEWAEGPLYSPHPWDVVVLQGRRLPGVCEVSSTPSRKVDVKSGTGVNGGTTTLQGYTPAGVDIKVRVWTAEQWRELQSVLATIWPGPGKADPKAHDIYHPALSALNIKAVIVQSVSTLQPGTVRGEKALSIKCVEFLPPKRANASKTPRKAEATAVRPEFANPAQPKTVNTLAGPKNYVEVNGRQQPPSFFDNTPF